MINITVINNDGVQTNYQVDKLEIHQPVPNFWAINLPEQQVEIPLDYNIISSVDIDPTLEKPIAEKGIKPVED